MWNSFHVRLGSLISLRRGVRPTLFQGVEMRQRAMHTSVHYRGALVGSSMYANHWPDHHQLAVHTTTYKYMIIIIKYKCRINVELNVELNVNGKCTR